MDHLKVAEGRASPKREHRLTRARNQRAIMRTNILDATAQVNGVASRTDENGVVRMKIVVKKQDLKQMLQVIRGGSNNNIVAQSSPSPAPSLCLEQRLSLMRRRQPQVKSSRRSSWRPALHSIPEEQLDLKS